MSINAIRNKVLGGLFGQAFGDAWGMPAMLDVQESWDLHHGWIKEFRPAPENHPIHRGFKAAVVTDDTEQALALAEAIIIDGKVTPEGVAREIIKWYDRIGGDTSSYVGPSTRRAVLALKKGADIYTTGRHSYTNGAAMRISVVGLIHPGDIYGAVNDTYLACIPTHNTDIAISGASAISGAIAYAMKDDVSIDEIIEASKEAAEIGRTYGPHYMGPSISRRIDLAVGITRSSKSIREKILDINQVVGNGLPIADSVPAALGLFLLGNGDPLQTAIYGAAAAGDADTVSAMACAIAGAWKGLEGFDQKYIDQICTANPEYDFYGVGEALTGIAEKNMMKSPI